MRFYKVMLIYTPIILLLSNLFWNLPNELSSTEVFGSVWGTWTAANGTYYLTDNVTIPYGKTLIIEPGVEVIANGSFHILVGGNLIANGTDTFPITFSGENFTSSNYAWDGLMFSKTSTGIIQNCTIKNATCGITLNATKNLMIKNTEIVGNLKGVIIENNSEFNSFNNSNIRNNKYGVLLENSKNNQFSECWIEHNMNWGMIFFDSSFNTINNSWIRYNGLGINFDGESFSNLLINSHILSNSLGIISVGIEMNDDSINNKFINMEIYKNDIEITNLHDSNTLFLDCFIDGEVKIKDSDKFTFSFCDISKDIILITVTDFEISNCNLYTDYSGLQARDYSKNIKIQDCNIHGTSRMYGGASSDNSDVRGEPIAGPKYGMSASSSNNITILNTSINGFDIGIQLSYSEDIQITNSIISNNTFSGCTIGKFCLKVTLDNCRLERNDDGLLIYSSDDIVITNCKINHNSDNGLIHNTSTISIYDSDINENTNAGIFTEYGELFAVNCTLLNNQYSVVIDHEDPSELKTVHIINCNFDPNFRIDDSDGKIYIGWFLDITIQTLDLSPVKGASVQLTSAKYNNKFLVNQTYLTDENGKITQKVCYSLMQGRFSEVNYNPYQISIIKPDVGVASQSLSITKSRDLTFTLEPHDLKITVVKIDWLDNRIPTGAFFNVSVDIKSTIGQDLYTVGLKLLVTKNDSVELYNFTALMIPGGGTITGTLFTEQLFEPGAYNLSVIIDFHNEIFELYEDNNIKSISLLVVNRPVAVLELNKTKVYVGENLTIYANKSYGDAEIIEYIFDLGDGKTISKYVNNIIIYNYDRSGLFTITLQVIDIFNIPSKKVNLTVNVLQPSGSVIMPVSKFTINPSSGNVTTAFYFNSSLSVPSEGNKLIKYLWSFGDNITSSIVNPIHKFTDDGIFEITLEVEDSKHLKAISKQILYIYNLKPQINLSVNKPKVKVGECMVFNANETYDPDDTLLEPLTRFIWDFGDGNNYSESPSIYPDGKYDMKTEHRFSAPGEYIVTLVVYDDDGGNDSSSIKITVVEGKDDDATSQLSNLAILIGITALLCFIIIIIILLLRRRNRMNQHDGDSDSNQELNDSD